MAAVGFLARYTGGSRDRYEVALRILFRWCYRYQIPVLEMKRSLLEMFGRYLETERGNAPQTVQNMLSIVRCFYRFAEIDGYVEKSPAEHVRMPRAYRDESRSLGLDKDELLALFQRAQASSPAEAAMVALMGMLGLRVSEACGVNIEDFAGSVRGHRVLRLVGKGKKPATIPLPGQVLATLEAAAADRTEGALLLRPRSGLPMNRKAVDWALTRLRRQAGIDKAITPQSLRHTFVTVCLDAGIPLRDVQVAARHSDPRLTAGYDRGRKNLDDHAVHTLMEFLSDENTEEQPG
nr:tyrosine-type recombinase/integrase [Arthrobacter sp. SF27]